jgi:hypothetical protein
MRFVHYPCALVAPARHPATRLTAGGLATPVVERSHSCAMRGLAACGLAAPRLARAVARGPTESPGLASLVSWAAVVEWAGFSPIVCLISSLFRIVLNIFK